MAEKKAAKSKRGGKSVEKDLTIERSLLDFKRAYRAKRKLIEREKEDFLFALGKQWSDADAQLVEKAGFKPFTDNRIQPNLFLLTGLERQNRSDFKAYPIGEEDGIKAEIASALFEDAIRKSGFRHKSSEQFKDGITCGESHLELFLDFTESLINGKPKWRKCDGNTLFWDPESREYDFDDARFVYKVTLGVSRGDLLNLYPEMSVEIEESSGGKIDAQAIMSADGNHRQPKDYPMAGKGGEGDKIGMGDGSEEVSFDLIERYYRKHVKRVFIGDKKTGEIKEAENKDKALAFVKEYQDGIARDQQAYEDAIGQAVDANRARMGEGVPQPAMPPAAPALQADGAAETSEPPMVGEPEGAAEIPGAPVGQPPAAPAPAGLSLEQHVTMLHQAGQLPPAPPQQDPQRFMVFERMVPEIWCLAHTPGVKEPLADERAWFYPKWKTYPFVPYFARFSTAPLTGDDRHLLIQGLVHGVKGAQEKHNKTEMLMLRHLNSSANSGWLAEEDVWVDPKNVKEFGTTPGVNLEYKKGAKTPQRIEPAGLSQGHAAMSAESAEAIKAQLGINSDLLAAQQGGGDSGRAIALRQKQGLLMVQELFDNHSRSREIAGRLILSQLGEMYDTESAMKVLGEAFLKENFPPVQLHNPDDPNAPPKPMSDEHGRPMEYDKQMAEIAIAEVLTGDLGDYDVSIGEVVASETQRMANNTELTELSKAYPGLVPPEVVIRHSQLPDSTKKEITSAIQQQQAAAAAAQMPQTVGAGQGPAMQ